MQQAPDFSKRGSGLLVYPTSSIALSDTGYLFDFIEFVERLDRRQRIDVEAFDLIPDLHQHGIVQLKHRQLHVLGTGTLGGFLHGLRRGLTPPLLKTAARHDLVAAVDQLEVAAGFHRPAKRSMPAYRPCGQHGYRTNAPYRRVPTCAERQSGCRSP